jgi:hypothetical protein
MNDKGEIDGYEEDQLHGMDEKNAFKAALAYLREQHLYCFWCGCKVVVCFQVISLHAFCLVCK